MTEEITMAFKRILLRRDTSSNWTSGNAVLAAGEVGYETNTGKFKIGNGSTAWTSLAYSVTTNLAASVLNDLGDVTITSAADGDFLRWNGTAWINDAVNLSTDTIGSFVQSLVAGTGVTLSNNSGENATPTVAVDTSVIQARVANITDTEIGYLDGVSSAIQTQLNAKAPTASPTFTGTVTVPTPVSNTDASTKVYVDSTASTTASNAATALSNHEADTTNIHGIADTSILVTTTGTQTLTNKTITTPAGLVKGDVGLGNVDNTSDANKPVSTAGQTALDLKAPLASPTFTGTVVLPDNTVALGTKTTGDYVATITGGTGVSSTAATTGEGTTHSLSIGQAVATTDNVTFAGVTADAIKVGVTAANEIDTTSGGLTIDSAGGTVTVDDNLTVTGNLTVSGTTTSINTETLTVDDNIIVLNNNVTASPTENAGIEIERGSETNVVIRWNETDDKWQLTNDGTTYSDIATASSVATATGAVTVDNLSDATITSAAAGQFLKYNGSAWVNDAIDLTTDTVGNYVATLTAGTGITLTNNSGEGASPTVTVDTTVIQAKVTNVTDTEIGYLDGVTSAIQTQIDLKAPLASPTFTGTVTLPSGTVTSAMILDGTIVDADINASAAIALSKLATSTAGNIIVYNSSGVPTSVAETGDVTITDAGVTAIGANKVTAGMLANSVYDDANFILSSQIF